MYIFTCDNCTHKKDGKCEEGYELDEYQDAYDCIGFDDKDPL